MGRVAYWFVEDRVDGRGLQLMKRAANRVDLKADRADLLQDRANYYPGRGHLHLDRACLPLDRIGLVARGRSHYLMGMVENRQHCC